MARGWESKHVEAQQDEASRRSREPRQEQTDSDRVRLAERRRLTLARERVVADLALARSPAHRQMLERAIAALDGQLQSLGDAGA